MSIHIDTSSLQHAKSNSCHFIPCEIDSTNTARVSSFFTNTISKDGDELSASLRGRPLNGREIDVPKGYTGLVLREPHSPSIEEEDRQLIVASTFDAFTYWNLDKKPTPDDLLQKSFQWIDVAAVLHAPVKPETNRTSEESSQSNIKEN